MEDRSKPMSLSGHLKELRERLIRSLIVLAIAFVFTYTYAEDLYGVLTEPLIRELPMLQRFLIFTTVGEPFFTYLKAAFIGAVFVSAPYLLYEAWAFIAPGLYEKEKKWFLPFLLASILFFLSGIAFAYFLVLPIAFKYLLGFSNPALRPFLSIGEYFSMVVKFLLAFGAAFQLPLLILILSRVGITDYKTLLGYWRYAVVGSFVIAAILTPPDVVSQTLMGVPLIILYFLGVALARIFGGREEEG